MSVAVSLPMFLLGLTTQAVVLAGLIATHPKKTNEHTSEKPKGQPQ